MLRRRPLLLIFVCSFVLIIIIDANYESYDYLALCLAIRVMYWGTYLYFVAHHFPTSHYYYHSTWPPKAYEQADKRTSEAESEDAGDVTRRGPVGPANHYYYYYYHSHPGGTTHLVVPDRMFLSLAALVCPAQLLCASRLTSSFVPLTC